MVTRTPQIDSDPRIIVALRTASKPGSVKAHADVRVEIASLNLEIFGLSVVQHDPEKPAWVSYPQRSGRDAKKYFPIVKVAGVLHEKICTAVLREFERVKSSTGNRNEAQSAGEEDSVPF
jgi:DNA-binding cell septation regulator SpoVG